MAAEDVFDLDVPDAGERVAAEPELDEAVNMMRGISSVLEQHHGIDVLDEAGSRARLSLSVVPQELREMEDRIVELAKEKEAAIQNQEFEKAASYRDKEKDFRKQLAKVKREWNESRSVSTTNVDAEDIAVVFLTQLLPSSTYALRTQLKQLVYQALID